jgi:hypothetical protein
MERKALSNFFRAIREDNRIGTSHISLYMALLECWNQHDFQNPVFITRKKLMEDAKINGLGTYHKCIRDLHDYGYIRYQPSYNPAIQSKVTLLVE